MAGGINTAVTYVIYLGLLHIISYKIAYTVTYALGIALGYWINARWVFRTKFSVATASLYPFTYFAQYLLGLFLLWFFIDIMGIPKELGPIGVVAGSLPVTYLLTRTIFNMKKE